MSDSDETNLLLLIPPDFFMVNPSNGGRTPDSDDGAGSSVSAKMYRSYKPAGDPDMYNPNTAPNQRTKAGNDVSFRSGSLYRDDMWSSDKLFVHSTPKVTDSMLSNDWKGSRTGSGGDPVIKEIDSFLNGKDSTRKRNSLEVAEETLHAFRSKCSISEGRQSMGTAQRKLVTDDEPLMSLSAIWSREEKVAENSCSAQEERMRRKHCEQMIQVLQQKVLEFEQKIAVAIKVDRRKDEVLAGLKQSNMKLANKVNSLELETDQRLAAAHQKYEDEVGNLKRSNDNLQSELNRTLVSNRHLNECNELLEQKIAHITRSTGEVQSGHRQQISEMEVRLSNAVKSEEIQTAELAKWKSVAAKLKAEIKSNAELDELRLNVKKLGDELSAEKERNECVVQQCQEKINSLLAKEKTLILELETQRLSLKSFYQAQLNDSVAQKVAEFQHQLDCVEATLRAEGKQRERTIAERAIRQMELINQKNEQEFTLITEKHREECDLHQMQLANAKQIVTELTQKVEAFHSKRTDMAERLHTVMETQWQRALEILASPTTPERNNAPIMSCKKTNAENDIFQTPTTSRCNSQPEKESVHANNDRVNSYIEMLLEKSPRDLDQLNAILEQPADRSRSNPQRRSSDVSIAGSNRRHSKQQSGLQPWK